MAARFEPEPAGARVLSRFELATGPAYAHIQSANGYLSTYRDLAQFQLSLDRKKIHARLRPGLGLEWVATFMAGSYPAFLLFLGGRVPLHASAIWLPALHGAVGVLGTPGSGKSTLAGALCLAGGKLISDDLLSLEDLINPVIPAKAGTQRTPFPGDSLFCQPGSRQLRLRQSSAELAERFGSQRISESPDGRYLVDAREDLPGRLPLKALIQPVLDRQAVAVKLDRLRAVEAFQAVACDPRIKGLSDPGWIEAAFDHAGRLVRAVPVYRVVIPYRERNFTDIGQSLVAALRGLA
jgi:hypothetical protein